MKSRFFAITCLLLSIFSSCSNAFTTSTSESQPASSIMLSSLNESSLEMYDSVTSSEEPPVNLSVLMEVHSSLPAFIIESTSTDDLFLSLTIKNSVTQELVQIIDLDNRSPEYEPIRSDPNAITVIDANFDGYNDLKILTGSNGNWRIGNIFFVWDSISNQFIADPYGLNELGLPYFDEETQTIESMNRGNATDHWLYDHKYIHDQLTLVKEISYLDAHPSIETYEKMKQLYPDKELIWHFTKKELNDNTYELETTVEVYCFEMELIEDELTPTEIIFPDSELGQAISLQYSSSL